MSDLNLKTFLKQFSDDESCLKEIINLRYPKGIRCAVCRQITNHYQVKNRTAYACVICRTQTFPLAKTIFAKTTTPLHLWFFALFLMTYTRGTLSIKDLQRELRVTYKTAWRMFHHIHRLMKLNNADLLTAPVENNLLRWTFFNRFEIKVIEKEEKVHEEKG